MHAIELTGSVDGWRGVPIVTAHKSDESLVPVHGKGLMGIAVYAGQYRGSSVTGVQVGATKEVLVRRGVLDRLKVAAAQLPAGITLVVLDGYRSYQTQASLYQFFTEKHHEGGFANEDDRRAYVEQYVSLPSRDQKQPAPHSTGAAVDVVLMRRAGEGLLRPMNFGTPFDYSGAAASLDYYEGMNNLSRRDREARDNRRLLYVVMTDAGFAPYPSEWWHYNDPASQMGARYTGLTSASYGLASLDSGEKL